MKKPIYIDMDDVIADSIFTYLDVLEKEYGKKASYADVHTFDMQKSFDLDDALFEDFFRRLHSNEVMLSIKPVSGSKNVLDRWADQGYPIHIVTGRPECTRGATHEWLTTHDMPFDALYLVDKYGRDGFIKSGGLPLEVLQQMTFSFAVEDSVKMACFISEKMKIPVALIDRPWNAALKENHLIRRYASWNEIGREWSFA